MKKPKISLIGAGIGDPDLITVKGLKALQSADVVLYDALANELLLAHVPPHAPRIFVGKRADRHAFEQSEINEMLVRQALLHGHAVRLKGGDPFVFGRGHEEAAFARAQGIEVEVIAGISSAIAAPMSAGIPVTRRGVAESFWVLTGQNTEGVPADDLRLAAQSSATVVILMGLGRLPEIVGIFREAGKSATPAAVIQDASLPTQKVAVGTVETIVFEVEKSGLKAPAVIVIGDVAAFATQETQNAKRETHNYNE